MTWMSELPPFLPFYLAAALLPLLPAGWRRIVLVGVPLLGGLNLWFGVTAGTSVDVSLLAFDLTVLRADKLSLLFGYLFHLAALLGVIFALHVQDRLQQAAALAYAGSALGAVFAGDLLTLLMFWEMLALTSVFLIWARRSPLATRAGLRYLIFQVAAGMLLLAGALVHFQQTGSLAFNFIGLDGLAGWLIFLAFGIKCAFPFLHTWLTDAYPEATITGTVFLSAFTTKLAVYALARGFPGTELLIYIGLAMACFPIFYAVIENDLRRVLAYSLINQLGFMVVGIGIGTELALNGTVAHAFSHVIYKGLLFMSMGAVLYRVGHVLGSDLGGLYKTMPKTAVLCIIGAASISAFPLFSGFISKSMVMSAMLYEGYDSLWLLLLFASAGVFHHAGIKVPYFAFFAHDSGIRTQEAPPNMLLAMALAAGLCVFIGSQPQYLYSLLPWEVDYWPYDTTHVLAQTQLLFFSALAFVWLNKQGLYPPELRSVNLDIDWLYRKLLPHGAQALAGGLGRSSAWLGRQTHQLAARLPRSYTYASAWSTSHMTQRLALLLAVFILVSLIV